MAPCRSPSLSLGLATLLLLPLVLASLAAPGAAAATPVARSADGVWQDQDQNMFRITQEAASSSLDSSIVNDTCTGGPRSYMITGSVDGASINGTMQRCSPEDDNLVVNCNLTTLWETPFSANITEAGIVGEFRGEYWVWDVDANGTWVNCTIDYYFQEPFAFARVDCGVQSFEALADHHMRDASKREAAIALAKSFETGEKLVWTEGQLAPGGFKEKVDRLIREVAKWGYTSTLNSAYRPILYQAHFADLKICAVQLRDVLIAHPDFGPALADSVAAVNAEVDKHHISFKYHNLSGLSIKEVFVCWQEPLTNCPHPGERAADVSIKPDNPKLDWIASMYGMCRPYLYAKTPDRPHWEYLGLSAFGNPKCNALGNAGLIPLSISGNSPVNLLLEDSNGYRIGYDPGSGSAVNDFGSGGYYSGPGTQPQVIELSGDATTPGAYSVTGVGTGDGDYTVDFTATNFEGVELDAGQVAGHATAGAPIVPLNFTVREDYSPPPLWTAGAVISSSGGSTDFAVVKDNATQTVHATGGAFTDLMFSLQGNVIALKDDGAGGSTRVTIPRGLMGGEFTVRVDGDTVPFTSIADGNGVTVVFDRPSGAEFITIEGESVGSAPATPPGDNTPLIVVGAIMAAAAAIAVFYLWRRRAKPAITPPT